MSDLPDYTKQPKPEPREAPGMHDLAIADITQAWARSDSLIGSPEEKAIVGVILELEERRAFGLKKYGTLLQANNGRDSVRDALDEALDLIVYVRQILEEIPEDQHGDLQFQSMYRNAIEFAIALKFYMKKRDKDDNSGPSETGSPDLAR